MEVCTRTAAVPPLVRELGRIAGLKRWQTSFKRRGQDQTSLVERPTTGHAGEEKAVKCPSSKPE
jgi:hypothetical protein